MAEEKILVLAFEEYPDDEVRVLLSPVPIATFKSIIDAHDRALSKTPAEVLAMCDEFAPLLRSWTFPEPCDRAGMEARDPTFLMALVRNWFLAVARVPVPLAIAFSGGAQSPEPSANEANPPA